MELLEENVAAAGRVLLEVIQVEWEPLSHSELDQRLERVVEEMIEADLVAQVQEQVNAAPQLKQDLTTADQVQAVPKQLFQESALQRSHATDVMEANPTVQYVTNFLQSSNPMHIKRRMSGRAKLSLSHTALLSLTLLSKRVSYRSVSSSFHLEKGNIHRIFFSFCDQVIAQQHRIIQWPTAIESLLPFASWLSGNEGLEEGGLPRVVGVLGETHIPIRLPFGKPDSENNAQEAKRLKSEAPPDSWLNLELVCDLDERFVYCHISKGSERVQGRDLLERLQQQPEMVPPGTCLIAGVGYPLSEQILTPFPICQTPQENLYNRALLTHLSRFQQAIADLKERFQKLRYLDMGNFNKAKAVVLTACILHNVLLEMGDVTKGVMEDCPVEDVEEVVQCESGVRMRQSVMNVLYSLMENGSQ
ncbi:hypothetical protein DNTS_015684 [Danionella cerebrum]|nr:hypothetical protein DNTS_015684 [Danionella translucida]